MISLLLLLTAIVIVAAPWVTATRHGLLPWISPLHFVAYFATFGVLLKTLAAIAVPGTAYYAGFIRNEGSVLLGYLYMTGFMLCLCFGYVAGIRRRPRWDIGYYARISVFSVGRPWTLATIGIAIFLLAAATILRGRGLSGLGAMFQADTLYQLNTQKIVRLDNAEGFGDSFAAIKSFFILPTLAFTLWLARQILRPGLTNLVMAALLAAVVVFSIVFQAKRMELLDLFVYYICLVVLLGRRISPAVMVKAALAIGAVILLFAAMTTLRATKGGLENAEFDIAGPLMQITGSTYFLDINMPVIILDRAPAGDRFWGISYLYWLFGWIPRAIWENKPAISLGPYVKQVVFGIYGSVGGINPTGPGEALLNFGWGGMAVGGALGWIYRRIEEYLLHPVTLVRKGGLWLYPLVFYGFVQGTLQSSFSGTVVSGAAAFVTLRALLWLLMRRPARNSRRPARPHTPGKEPAWPIRAA